jgi:hypothetical protein
MLIIYIGFFIVSACFFIGISMLIKCKVAVAILILAPVVFPMLREYSRDYFSFTNFEDVFRILELICILTSGGWLLLSEKRGAGKGVGRLK